MEEFLKLMCENGFYQIFQSDNIRILHNDYQDKEKNQGTIIFHTCENKNELIGIANGKVIHHDKWTGTID
jgi:hypothetical protein